MNENLQQLLKEIDKFHESFLFLDFEVDEESLVLLIEQEKQLMKMRRTFKE